MTQEEKSLLLKDLCSRLPYGVKIQVYYEDIASSGYFDETIWSVDNDEPFHVNDRLIENIKPYLRTMSSMTEEEINEFHKLKFIHVDYGLEPLQCVLSVNEIDWLNSHHFDYRNLIEKGLAIEVPEGMYDIK